MSHVPKDPAARLERESFGPVSGQLIQRHPVDLDGAVDRRAFPQQQHPAADIDYRPAEIGGKSFQFKQTGIAVEPPDDFEFRDRQAAFPQRRLDDHAVFATKLETAVVKRTVHAEQ